MMEGVYIGKEDKSGNSLYEGDVVIRRDVFGRSNVAGCDVPMTIEWDNEHSKFVITPNGFNKTNMPHGDCLEKVNK